MAAVGGGSLADFEDFLKSLHPQCAAGGCKLPDARKLLAAAERLAGKNARGEIVSQALWCDQGGHAFSARDPQAEHWERQAKDKDGATVTIPWDVCGEHMTALNSRLAAMEREIGSGSDHPAPA
jgi:hypothetical protein